MPLHRKIRIMQIAFTYIGTIVGAGFASGQEILQFFSRFGWIAVYTIAIAAAIFLWLGIKLMILAHEIGAASYEDLNKRIFGERIGGWVSLFILIVLFGITTVMLAGGGTIFREHLHLPFLIGLLVTLALTYWTVRRGVSGILSVNSVVVPLMLCFTAVVVWTTLHAPGAANFARLPNTHSSVLAWCSPFMYAAFNLALAQAVLVPIGAKMPDRQVIYWGGALGAIGIGLMLLAGHFALSARLPDIAVYEIPMGHIVERLGPLVQTLYALVIYAEIFTTYVADIYGLTLQLSQRTGYKQHPILLALLAASFAVSLFGFRNLLSILYPLFGFISVLWFGMMVVRRQEAK